MAITAIVAIIFTYYGADTAIAGVQARHGEPAGQAEFAFGALLVPALAWIAVVYFYEQYKKENRQAPTT